MLRMDLAPLRASGDFRLLFASRTVTLFRTSFTPLPGKDIYLAHPCVCGLSARFRHTPIEQIRAFDAQLAQMLTFFNEHPSELSDLSAFKRRRGAGLSVRDRPRGVPGGEGDTP
jgi:hypothetical protein